MAPTALHIKKYCRFGNNIIQTYGAIGFAKQLGIKKIYIGDVGSLFLLNPGFHSTTIDGVLLTRDKPGKNEEIISDKFFHAHTFGGHTPDIDISQCRKVFDEVSNKVMGIKDRNISDELFIHLRSGDIFTLPKPKRNYVQPPLSFYQKAIIDQIELTDFSGIRICFEDYHNPVIGRLIDWCKTRLDLPVTIQSKPKSLSADLKELFKARHIITSFGSFIPMICCLSGGVERLSYFRDLPGINYLKQFDTRLVKYVDDGSYMKKWAIVPHSIPESDAQKEMLVTYPKAKIKKEVA